MKSVAFLRNTWKKWEQKTFDNRDEPRSNTRRESQNPAPHPQPSGSAGRPLAVTVKRQPLEDTTASVVQGAWRPTKTPRPSSPVHDEFVHCRGERTLVHRDRSRFNLDGTYTAQGIRLAEEQRPSSDSKLTVKKSTMRLHPTLDYAPTRPQKSSQDGSQVTPSRISPTRQRFASSPSSPRQPSLSSSSLLPSVDLDRGTAKCSDSPEGNTCHCGRLAGSRHSCRCPRFSFQDAQTSMTNLKIPDAPPSYSMAVHATPRSLYNRTAGSTPHLPYQERPPPSAKSEHSTCSASSSDADHFTLSLFPAPPPLLVRKKIPAPLVFRPAALPSSSQSSRDSTPVGTPTTPRFQQPMHSPTQSNVASPPKKVHLARSTACISPPPFSPPNSPLPSLPASSEKPATHRHQHLRTAQSTIDLRNALPFPATHRLTSSEPISDQASLPIKKSTRHHIDTGRARDLHAHTMDMKADTTSVGSSEAQVQWGYAI